jgi:MOSC domain-containing protein YiiM
MKVVSVNVGSIKNIEWRGKNVLTGIYKLPCDAISLNLTDVDKDKVVDRKYHGGFDKACYIYSENHYKFWQNLYPHLDWTFGMFGENVTIKDLNETTIFIGDIYKLGEATVQVTQPREPCFKLGVKFETQKIIKQFINQNYPGIYLKVIEKGIVKPKDTMQLIERQHDTLSVVEVWRMLYDHNYNIEDIEFAINLPYLAESYKTSLLKKLKSLNN